MEWFEEVTDLHEIITIEPCDASDAINISFSIGDGSIRGYAHAAGARISAMLGKECWDFLFDEDVVVQRGASDWFCTLCPAEDRQYFPAIEALWRDHLFARLRRWVDEQLRPATALEFHRMEGATWARLTTLSEESATATSVNLLRFPRV